MPNKSSFVVGEIWQQLASLNHCITFFAKDAVNGQSIKVCSMESLFPQYRHSSSVLIPNLNSSFLVITILWISLNWNSFSLVSLQTFFSDLKILVHESLCRLSTSNDHLPVYKQLVESWNCSPYIHIFQLSFLKLYWKTFNSTSASPLQNMIMEERLRHEVKSSSIEKHFPCPLHSTELW